MNDLQKFRDLIPGYISGKLAEGKKKQLEEGLTRYPELRDELYDLSLMSVEFEIEDSISVGHLDSEDITIYAEDPDLIDSDSRYEFEKHLQECSECSEELELCRESFKAVTVKVNEAKRYRLYELIQYLFPPGYAVRSALAYLSVILIGLSSYLLVDRGEVEVQGAKTFEIPTASLRGSDQDRIVAINKSTNLVVLQFMLPTRVGHTYDLEILEANAEPIVTFYNRGHQLPIAIEVPTSYFSSGQYVLRIINEKLDGETITTFEPIEIEFTVEITE